MLCIRQGILKHGRRETFTQAFIQSGVPANAAEKCIDRMTRHQDKWLEIIDSSFLPDDLKTSYKELILARLKLITGHVF